MMIAPTGRRFGANLTPGQWAISINLVGRSRKNSIFLIYKLELKEAFFAVSASRQPKMDRLRPAMLIAALVVDVGRRLPRRGGSTTRLIRV